MSFNTSILTGNLTHDPTLKYTTTGIAVCSFMIAVNNGFGENADTLFIKVNTYKGTAENCAQHLKKGSPVLVEGKLKQERWENREGKKQSQIVLNTKKVQFLPRSNNGIRS